jgi:hypothetical protein
MDMTIPVPAAQNPEARGEGVGGAAAPGASPLSENDFLMIRRARAGRKVVRRSATVAAWDAGITLTIGLAGLLISMFWWSWLGFFITLGITAVGVAGLVGWDHMQDANPSAATLLGINQLVLMALIVLYCVIRMATFSPSELQASTGLGISLTDIGPAIINGFYTLIIVVSVLGQGAMALYYFTRRRGLLDYRHDTPEWVLRLFRELNL